MFGLRTLFRKASRVNRTPARPRTPRLGLEQLEDRLIPSVTSFGSAFDVSGLTKGGQSTDDSNRTVARAPNGNFAVVWTDNGINVRLFNQAGTALTSIVHISGTTSSDHSPSIAMSANCTFVVAWTHPFTSTDDDVYAQRFSTAGAAQGPLLGVATTTHNENTPSVAMDSTGNFVVAFTYQYSSTDLDVYAQRYNAQGIPQIGPIHVATSAHSEFAPSVAMNGAGNFVIAYTYQYNSTDLDVHAKRFDAQGNSLGGEISVATSTNYESNASVGMDQAGNFVVAYTSYQINNGDLFQTPTAEDVFAARFNASGTYLGKISVATTAKDEFSPSLSMDANGNFAIAYTYAYSFTDPDVHLKYYNGAGTLLSGDIAVAHSTDEEYQPSVALDNSGNLVVVWTNYGHKQGGYGDFPTLPGVFAQQYRIT